MVLINELTVEQINAALLHLQRSKDEVVGGNKGTTIQNISVNNSGGGGNNVDYLGTIKLLARNIEANKDAIDKNTSDISSLKDDMKNIEKSVEETLQGLVDSGVSDLSFDSLTKQLTITTNAGDTFQTVITQDIGVLSYDSVNNKLVLTTGEQSQEITLPYILSSEKGSANGVATLDENGRVPYSQLPESAMEFLGQWNASTNTPHLADGTGDNGDFYIVSTGGTVNLGTTQNPHIITFSVNDRIVYEGDIAQWVRLPAGQVSSVNGQSGAVVLTASDIDYSTGVTIKDKIDANAVQSDWNVTDTSSLAYIKNKPTIPASPVQSDWNASDTTSLAYIKNKPSLATVATSGSYTDLSNKPTIPAAQIQSDWTQTNNACKDYIKNKPTIPTDIIKAVCANGFWGMADPSGADNVWIRTTTQGIIPYQSGGANAGHGYIGTNTWYFADAYIQNIHGTTVSATTVSATTVTANGYQLKRYYELDLSSLSTSNFYPITFPGTDLELDCEIHSPNLGGSAAYNQNYIHFKLIAQGWSDAPKRLVIEQYAVFDANEITIGSIGYGTGAGGNCVWVRGGMKYRFYSNQTPTLHSTDYTYENQTYTVGTNRTGGTNVNVTIMWIANGVNSATYTGSLYADLFRGPVADSGNACATTFAYSKEGLTSNPSWLAAWNGYELRAVSPSVVCVASAGNASCAGLVYLDSYNADADRPVMVTSGRGTTGYSDQGVSTVCPLTFNPATGVLTAKCFSGVAQYVGQSLGNRNTRYDIALLNNSPIGTGWFNEIAYACCRTLRYNPVTCTLYACNICGNVLTPNTWITVYSSEYAEIKEMGVSGLYCFKANCNCIMGQYLYSALECALYYAYGRTFLPSTDRSLYFPVLGRCEDVDRDNKNMGEIINEISASNNIISYGVTGGWYKSVSPSQTSCVNTRCFQFMFSGQHIS